tara:strand:+ start:9829 stop:9960 length:132 start_codon:yes stop_codon:yes gene_type:complete
MKTYKVTEEHPILGYYYSGADAGNDRRWFFKKEVKVKKETDWS